MATVDLVFRDLPDVFEWDKYSNLEVGKFCFTTFKNGTLYDCYCGVFSKGCDKYIDVGYLFDFTGFHSDDLGKVCRAVERWIREREYIEEDCDDRCETDYKKAMDGGLDMNTRLGLLFIDLPDEFEWVDRNNPVNYSLKSILVLGDILIYLKEYDSGCTYVAESGKIYTDGALIPSFSLTVYESCVDDAKFAVEKWLRSHGV